MEIPASGGSAAAREVVREACALSAGDRRRHRARRPDRSRRGRYLGGGEEKLHAATDHAGHHRRFRCPAPGAGKARARRRCPAARQSAAAAAAAAARQDPRLHRQLLGARAARGAPAQHVHEEPGRGDRPRRHHHAARIHGAVDVHARGRARAGDQGPGQDGEGQGLEERGVRLHRDDRRLRARARPPHLAGEPADQLARQILRHLRADRALHRHRRRDRRPQRPDRAVLERRPAAPQLQHRRHGAPRARAGRVRHHGDDHELRRSHRLRHQPRGAGRIAGRRDGGNRNPAHRQNDVSTVSDPLKRTWERGIYMGVDSTNPDAVKRHRPQGGGTAP